MVKKIEESIKPSLSPQKAIELFGRQISLIDHLKTLMFKDPEVDKWENFTEQLIIQAFGKPHGNLDAFYRARHGGPMWINMSDDQIQENYLNARENFRKLLEGFIEQLELFTLVPHQTEERVKSFFSCKSKYEASLRTQ